MKTYVFCPWIYGLLLECWLLFQKFEESQQNLKRTVTLSVTENKRHTSILYTHRIQFCKQIPSSVAVQIVWHLVGGKAWKQELHLSWDVESDCKKHWSNSFPEIRQWFQCTESVYCFKRRLINQYCIKQSWTIWQFVFPQLNSLWTPGKNRRLFHLSCYTTVSSHAIGSNGSDWAA